jgi:hypothetical protein
MHPPNDAPCNALCNNMCSNLCVTSYCDNSHNSMFLLTTSLLVHSWISVHLQKLLRSIRYTPIESIVVMAPETTQAKENVTFERTHNSWTDFISWTANQSA